MGTLAHELANVFVALGLTLQFEEKNAVVAGIADSFEVIRKELTLSKRLLEDLKDVGRIGSGRFELRRQPLVLNETLLQAADICRPHFEQRTQHFEVLLPSAEIHLEADPTRLHQIFLNLLNNASKYTREGGTVRLMMTTEGNHAVVKVSDTGVGIGPEMLPKLFELFTREESLLEERREGLGVGLWLAKKLVDLHQGTIGVRSDGRGKGSEFVVRLPLECS